MNIEWGHFISIYWILIKFCIAYKGFIQVECKHTMAKGSTANIFNENLTSADSSFRTLDLEIFRSISLTRNSHATITDDVRCGFYIFKNCRYIQLNAYFWWSVQLLLSANARYWLYWSAPLGVLQKRRDPKQKHPTILCTTQCYYIIDVRYNTRPHDDCLFTLNGRP